MLVRWPNKQGPFPNSSISSKHAFSLIHVDIQGGYHVASLLRAHLFITIVDDFSCATWVFLMHQKSEAQQLLRNFILYVKTQFNTNVQNVRTKNGQEFLAIELQNFFIIMPFITMIHVFILANKMGVLSENIITYLMQLVPFISKHIYLLLFGGIAS